MATIAENEHSDPTSQHEDDGHEVNCVPVREGRPNAPQLQEQLSPLSRTHLRCLRSTLVTMERSKQVAKIGDLSHTNVSHKWLHQLVACAGQCLSTTRLHHQRAEEIWLSNHAGEAGCRRCEPSYAVLGESQNPDDSQKPSPNQLMYYCNCPWTQGGSGRARGASSNAAAARGDAAQATFERKTLHY